MSSSPAPDTPDAPGPEPGPGAGPETGAARDGDRFRGLAAPLGPNQVRDLAARLDIRPTKTLGQNFVHDANTVRRIVTVADITAADRVVEVGPGLGSLTLPLLDAAGSVVAIEIDPVLAEQLPLTVAERAPALVDHLDVVLRDALLVEAADLGAPPTALVANLPYNVSVPVLIHLLERLPNLRVVLVMVQAEVADRLAAAPGSRVYGVPSVKASYYGAVRRAGSVGRNVFWPVPNVESGLVRIDIRRDRGWEVDDATRSVLFPLVDAAFAKRRKTLRAALGGWAGSPARAEELLRAAGVDPRTRGEQLEVADFVRIAEAGRAAAPGAPSPDVTPGA